MTERIVDACCLINLYASSEECSILRACGEFWVPPQVQREALRICRCDPADPTKLVSQDLDLSNAIAAGLIQTCQVEGPDESDAFIRYAMQLDDGEAACLAVAQVRRWTVATDDRKARRIASENGIALISTPELIERWAHADSPHRKLLAEVLRRIERFAKFRPRRTDPLYAWWVELSEADS